MIPPRGFKAEQYPLRHKVLYSFGLSAVTASQNSACATLVRGTSDMDAEASAVKVNPHNSAYVEDGGAAVRQMSIIDRLRLSIRFNMTTNTETGIIAATTYGDGLSAIKFLWRPIFFSFPEKLAAADEDTAQTVATILSLTSDDTNQDVVPITTTKLPVAGNSDRNQPFSTVNTAEAITDYNMTTDATSEEYVWDEDNFLNAMRRFTNKGALKACIGRTRHVTLTRDRPYKNFFLDKFVPRAIRRVVDRTFMAIMVHLPTNSDISQTYHARAGTVSRADLGVKIICHYHEWNMDHDQDMGSQV